MKRTKWLALFAVLALVLAACGDGDDGAADTTEAGAPATTEGPTATTEAPDTGGTAGQGGQLTLLQWQAPSTLNPLLSGGTKELLAASLILDPLAEYDPDGNLVATLAAEIPTVENGGVAEDLMSITWTLKDGVLWSDGSAFTADDVVFTWEYCTNTPDCTQSGFFTGVASVEAVDATHVLVTFDALTPFPYNAFVTFQSPIIQRAQFAECVGASAAACTDENFGPIGTGAYMVNDFKVNDTVLYDYNPNFRGAADGKPFFGTVLIKGGGDAEASARSVLVLGEADYGWNLQVDPIVLADMEATGLGIVKAGFASSVERIMVNQTDPNPDLGDQRSEPGTVHPFLTDPAVYQALSMAINRQELVDVGYGFAGSPTCNVWPGAPYASTANDACLTQDIDGANALLDAAGYEDTDGDGIRETADGTPLFILYQTSTNAVRQSNQDLVKSYWAQIGVDTELKNIDASVFFGGDQASPDTYQVFYADVEMYTNNSGSPDPQTYMSNWTTAQVISPSTNFGGGNIPRYSSAEYDALHEELTTTGDLDRRIEIVKELNDLVIQAGAMIPLIYRADVSAFANSIQGVGTLNGWDSEYWNVEDWTRSE
ncbi:MAG: peptide ABC transporter substrate-binding protein [Acidimicrobiia bacterium]